MKFVTDTEQLPADGERYLPGMGGRIAAEHLARYAFSERFVMDKEVLDVASGEGYGAAILAGKARSVIGVDLSEPAVLFAQRKYANVDKVHYQVGDVTALPFASGSFDIVTCFETVEHIGDPITAILELKRVLRENGTLVISTPNKEWYSDRFMYINPFHKKELSFAEFQTTLRTYFKHVRLFGQFSGVSSCVAPIGNTGTWPRSHEDLAVVHVNAMKWTGGVSEENANPLYLVAACSNHPPFDNNNAIEFFDPGDLQFIEQEFCLQDARTKVQTLDSAAILLRSDLQTAQHDLGATQHELQLSQQQLQDTQRDLATAQRELQGSQQTVHATRELTRRNEAEISALRHAFNALRAEYVQLNDELQTTKLSLDEASALLSEMSKSMSFRIMNAKRSVRQAIWRRRHVPREIGRYLRRMTGGF